MWDEYEITLSEAAKLKDEDMNDLPGMKRQIAAIKDDIKSSVMSMSMPLKITGH